MGSMVRLTILALVVATGPALGWRDSPSLDHCVIEIAFGSAASGVDGATRAAIRRYLDGEHGILSATNYPWGREGESTLCLVTRSSGDTKRISARIARLIPAAPAKNQGYTHVRFRTAAGATPSPWRGTRP